MDGYHHRRAHRHRQGRYHAAGHHYLAEVDPRRRATIVIDNNDLARPRLVRSER